VAKQFLNRAQVGASLQEMCCERMPQCVRTDPCRNRRFGDITADDAIDAAGGEPAAAEIQEQRCSARPSGFLRTSNVKLRTFADERPMIREHQPHRLRGLRIEWHQTLFSALAFDADDPSAQVEILEVHPDELAQAKTGCVEQFQDRAIATAGDGRYVRRLEQPAHVLGTKMCRQRALLARRADHGRGIVRQQILAH
jgi:hypothetical protein